jgi:hypothetical protein
MKITKADIGRRVVVNGEVSGIVFKNEYGVIVNESYEDYGIQFDNYNPKLHDLGGKEGHGWYVDKDKVTFIDKENKENKENKEKEKKMKKSKRCTGIRIETEKVIMVSGDFGYKILSVNALTRNKLPWMYLKGEPCVYLHKPTYSKHYLSLGNQKEIKVGNTYTILKFQELMDYCKKAGDRLMQVNKEIKERKKQWNGKETFVI